jgi:hypothetical protein
MEADKTGVKYDPVTKNVKVPEPYKPAIASFNEAGFPGLAFHQSWRNGYAIYHEYCLQ